MGFFSRKQNRRLASGLEIKEPNGKLYKTISSLSVTGIFVAVGILVLSLTGTLKISPNLWGIAGTIAMISVSLLLMLPWVRKIEKNNYKKVAYVFIGLIGLTAVLWIICMWIGIDVINKMKAGTDISDKYVLNVLRYLKITLIITLQFVLASTVAQGITKYLNSMIPFQVICYLSYAFVDFILTWIILCIIIKGGDVDFNAEMFKKINNRTIWSFLTLAIVYVAISSGVMNRVDSRRLQNVLDDMAEPQVVETKQAEEVVEAAPATPEERLEKLKDLYEKDVITKEEYEKKRKEILKDM